MIKTYKARTNISLNVFLEQSKKNLHVTFCAMSDGSSVFTTDDEHVQSGLEHHYKFGKLFKLTDSQEAAPTVEAPAEAEAEAEGDEVEKVELSDWDSAKDYLADRFGLTRTTLRSHKAITDAAKAHGIEIIINED